MIVYLYLGIRNKVIHKVCTDLHITLDTTCLQFLLKITPLALLQSFLQNSLSARIIYE